MKKTQIDNPYLYDLTPEQYIRQGKRCLREHNTEAAIYAFRQALLLHPYDTNTSSLLEEAKTKMANILNIQSANTHLPKKITYRSVAVVPPTRVR